jgi:hypothetical protein
MRAQLARAARWLAATCTRAADRLAPEACVAGDAAAQVAHANELIEHMRAGRIRPRRGESDREFCLRVARGDYVLNENLIDFQIERFRRAHGPSKVRARG